MHKQLTEFLRIIQYLKTGNKIDIEIQLLKKNTC